MICNDCGSALVKTARYCASCGSATYVDRAETQSQRNDTAAMNPGQTDPIGFANRPPAPAYAQGPAVGLAPYPACAYHSGIASAGACAACGHHFCRACMHNYSGHNYCASCMARSNPAMRQPQYYQQPYGHGYAHPYNYLPTQNVKSPGLALFLSFLLPGAGQIYNGDTGKGILLCFAFCLLVWILIGWIFWVVAMVDAYQSAQNINLGRRS